MVSKEPFLLGSSKWLSFLKLRLSYGKVGNDGIIDTPRFVHLPSIGQDQPSGSFRPGLGQISRYRITGYENNDVTWEIAEQAILGLETKFFNGLFEATVDIYQEVRHNVLANRNRHSGGYGIGFATIG